MMDPLKLLEEHRLELQTALDAAKSKPERNQFGQFATPTLLAESMLQYAKHLLPEHQAIRFLDPALGTGAFYSALLRVFSEASIVSARGYEVDPHYGEPARLLWSDHRAEILIKDFTKVPPPATDSEKFNLVICNPPYVRHHHLKSEDKKRLQAQAASIAGANFSGLSGLYVYFLCIAHSWLQEGGIGGWLIPSEFMDVNYGSAIRQYLTSEVTLLSIHRFDPEEVQFADALVSSVVVWFRKEKPLSHHEVRFSFGGSLDNPRLHHTLTVAALRQEAKWTRFPNYGSRSAKRSGRRFRDLFDIKRGVATGANDFFIVDSTQIHNLCLPAEFLIPILPSPRYLESDEISADASGTPQLECPLFLINCNLPEDQLEFNYPTLWRYFQSGVQKGVKDRYLCLHRSPWYAQDKREPAPFLCTYMGRASTRRTINPFRFILNHSKAVAPNVYLNLYPNPMLSNAIAARPDLKQTIWRSLQGIAVDRLVDEGRVYGGGLYKLEPKELGNLPIDDIFEDDTLLAAVPHQVKLF